MEKNMTGKICGTGSWAPDRVWDNNDLAKMVETSDQWIRERTGVVQRHIAKEDEDTVTMAAQAALRALEDAEMKAEEIDLILVATISPAFASISDCPWVHIRIICTLRKALA